MFVCTELIEKTGRPPGLEYFDATNCDKYIYVTIIN